MNISAEQLLRGPRGGGQCLALAAEQENTVEQVITRVRYGRAAT